MGTYFSFPDLFIWLPILAGLLCFIPALRNHGKNLSLLFSLIILGVSIASLFFTNDGKYLTYNHVSYIWLKYLGANYYIGLDGVGRSLTLLTAIVFPLIIGSNYKKEVSSSHSFYGLLMLSQAGLMGVFMAMDALSFYFFWELALIPIYFLSSIWGGENRIKVTFKFFIYTFIGSLMMLAGLIYLGLQTPGADAFSYHALVAVGNSLSNTQQISLFVLFFLAFAIKMPIFPFHTWQPDAYDEAPTSVTIFLSALMVKMGLYAVLRWLMPLLPEGIAYWSNTVIILSIIGIIYASIIALQQTNIKRFIAYSSIAHMGLMCAAAFVQNDLALHGVKIQMFMHGINIAGMWLVVSIIENRYHTKDMNALGGIASTMPKLAIAFVIISFANIALPLTNGFVGEFMLFAGIFSSANPNHVLYMVLAGLGVILGAAYTLRMLQKVVFGTAKSSQAVKDLSINEWGVLAIVLSLIIALGVYAKPLLTLTSF